MERLRQKQPRIVLNQKRYDERRKHVLERDGWKCQCCGSTTNLHVHHLKYRGRLGSDALDNLIALCADCHRKEHQNKIISITMAPS